MKQHLSLALSLRELAIELKESTCFRGRRARLHKHFEFDSKPYSLSIFNESNLLGNDNIGVTDDSNSQNGKRFETPSASKDGDDDGGDPDPERKRRTSKPKTITALPHEGYVRLCQILQVIPVCKSTWWQGVRDGRFPQSIKLGPRTTVWLVSDIRELIESLGGRNA